MRRIIDSHVHLCNIAKYNPDRIDWLITRRFSVISWAFGGNIGSVSDLKRYFSDRLSVFEDLRRLGLDCYNLCGIHPRKIPPDLKPESVAGLLVPFLDSPECLGIGEIGLETGSTLEQEILCAQLEMGISLKRQELRFGIHTPRREKVTVTAQLLPLLANYEALPAVTVIDHCTFEILGSVLSGGYHAGISLSPGKSSASELIRILKRHDQEVDRIMCNSDSGRDFFDDLLLTVISGSIEQRIAEKVFYGTSARFFGITDKRRAATVV